MIYIILGIIIGYILPCIFMYKAYSKDGVFEKLPIGIDTFFWTFMPFFNLIVTLIELPTFTKSINKIGKKFLRKLFKDLKHNKDFNV